MQNQISFSTYRAIDLTIWTFLVVVLEFLSVKATEWIDINFSLSLFLALSLIIIMRWNGYAVVSIIAGSVVWVLTNKATTIESYLIYILGNSFMVISMLWFIKGKSKLLNGTITTFYIITGYLAICLGRSLVGAIGFNANFLSLLISFLGTEAFNLVISIIVVFITKSQPGIFQDQKEYIRKIQEERE